MTQPLPTARTHRHNVDPATANDMCSLTYEERFVRRKVLAADSGLRFLVDFAHAASMVEGDASVLDDGQLIGILACDEALFKITGDDLTRIAWYIGNRHTPCQIEPARLLIQRDHVIHDMLTKIGATISKVAEPFTPEGGAYGHGRTNLHAH